MTVTLEQGPVHRLYRFLILLRREPHGWAIVSRVARQLDGGDTAFDLIATGLKGNTQ